MTKQASDSKILQFCDKHGIKFIRPVVSKSGIGIFCSVGDQIYKVVFPDIPEHYSDFLENRTEATWDDVEKFHTVEA